MTQEELEYNKRCAEFLGLTLDDGFGSKKNQYFKKIDNDKSVIYNNVLFHSDWNWIHEVIGKIKTSIITTPRNGISDSITPYLDAVRPITKGLIDNNKEKVVQAINQFLIWYENESKTNISQ